MYAKTSYDGHYDPESFKGPLNLPFAIWGNLINNITNQSNSQMIARGVERVKFYPQSEIIPHRQYVVALDVWNYDYGWKNTISFVFLLSTFAFIMSLQRAQKEMNM